MHKKHEQHLNTKHKIKKIRKCLSAFDPRHLPLSHNRIFNFHNMESMLWHHISHIRILIEFFIYVVEIDIRKFQNQVTNPCLSKVQTCHMNVTLMIQPINDYLWILMTCKWRLCNLITVNRRAQNPNTFPRVLVPTPQLNLHL